LGFEIDGEANKQERLSFSITEEKSEKILFTIDEGSK
jgi:hypothetical protein